MGVLGEQLVEVGWRAAEDQYRVVCLAAAFADSDEWACAGYSTPGRWIADMLDIARRTANEWIRVGRSLAELPLVSSAFESKSISFAKAKVLTRTATPATEAVLVELAQRVPAADLTAVIAAWSQRNEPDEVIDARHEHDRSLRWQVDADGSVVATIRMPPIVGGTFMSAIDARVMRQSQAAAACGDDWPSLAQQRLDAFVEMLGGEGGGAQFEVVLHVRGDGATLDDGTPVTESAVARMLPEAFIRALIHDVEARPINASSRRRHPTTRQQRVVKERDRVCIDCGSHDLLEYDHVPSFAETGHTVVEELELRCAPCHHFRHSHAARGPG